MPIRLYAANININFEPEEKAKPKNTGMANAYIALEDHLLSIQDQNTKN